MTKNRRLSVHKALDYSTIFFVLAVHFLILTIWEKSFLWLIVLFMIVLAMVFVIIHWKVKKEIVLRLIFKGVWRVNFLVFFIVYLMLTLYGLVQRVLEFV
jgi:4-hydroxybenzoate polyprenyltransferase